MGFIYPRVSVSLLLWSPIISINIPLVPQILEAVLGASSTEFPDNIPSCVRVRQWPRLCVSMFVCVSVSGSVNLRLCSHTFGCSVRKLYGWILRGRNL